MIQFLVPHVIYLSENGFDVELACSDVGGRLDEVRQALEQHARKIHQVRLVRNPASLTNLAGYRDLKKIIDAGHYDIIWTNEPVMGVMTRLAARDARKKGTKVLYMVHGFHFYKGAPLANWMLFYPVERICSRFCDMIVTINTADLKMAKTFHAGRVDRINGIGVNTERILDTSVDRNQKRRSLGIPEEAFFIVSVGELHDSKNHQVIIRSLSKIKDPGMIYGICGKGELLEKLKKLCEQCGVEKQVRFFGYRRDVLEILHSADLYVHPSRREGLGVAVLEAMASGLPLLTSNVGGLGDVIEDGLTGYSCDCNDVEGFRSRILQFYRNPELRSQMSEYNVEAVKKYDSKVITREVCRIMKELSQ